MSDNPINPRVALWLRTRGDQSGQEPTGLGWMPHYIDFILEMVGDYSDQMKTTPAADQERFTLFIEARVTLLEEALARLNSGNDCYVLADEEGVPYLCYDLCNAGTVGAQTFGEFLTALRATEHPGGKAIKVKP